MLLVQLKVDDIDRIRVLGRKVTGFVLKLKESFLRPVVHIEVVRDRADELARAGRDFDRFQIPSSDHMMLAGVLKGFITSPLLPNEGVGFLPPATRRALDIAIRPLGLPTRQLD